jgi:hypothetical protein
MVTIFLTGKIIDFAVYTPPEKPKYLSVKVLAANNNGTGFNNIECIFYSKISYLEYTLRKNMTVYVTGRPIAKHYVKKDGTNCAAFIVISDDLIII